MPFLKIFIRWWWTFNEYNRKHFPILGKRREFEMHFDLISFFHLVSVISFIKSTWLPGYILIKNSFCVPLKKNQRTVFNLERWWGCSGGRWMICLHRAPVSGLVSRAESSSQPRSLLTEAAWRCCWGEPPPRPHEGFTGFTPQSQVSLVTNVRQEKHDGKEDRHLFSSVSAKGDIEAVLLAVSKSFSKWEV